MDEFEAKYRALTIIYGWLKGIVKFLGFSAPFIFLLYFIGVKFWICLVLFIVYILIMRILWVQCDTKARVYEKVIELYNEEKGL